MELMRNFRFIARAKNRTVNSPKFKLKAKIGGKMEFSHFKIKQPYPTSHTADFIKLIDF